jgi:exodeoxyribonuclease V alpha subunit
VLHWDGSINSNGRRSFSTTIKESADFVQFAFSACGYRSTISVNDRVGLKYKTNNKEYIRKSIEYTVVITQNLDSYTSIISKKAENKNIMQKYKTKDGYKYCFTVESGMLILRRDNRIFITGNSGKSFSTNTIIQMLQDNNKSFTLFAPTGRAAKKLSEYTTQKASTIHRGLGYMPPDFWSFNEKSPIQTDVVIIDESSMVDIFLMKKVLEAIDFKKTKLLLIGDSAQIPSVSAGNIFHDIINSLILPITTLTKIFRYGVGGIMTVATLTRESKKFIKSKDNNGDIEIFGEDKGYVFIPCAQDTLITKLIKLYKKILDDGNSAVDIMVLSSYNKGEFGTVAINKYLQRLANPQSNINSGLKVGEITYYENDLIIQNVNNYKAKLYNENINNCYEESEDDTIFIANGEIGKIIEINNNSVIIDFDDKKVNYDRMDLQQIKLAYCISKMKSQGGQCKTVIFINPASHTYMLNSNLIYVAQTRAQQKCYHLGDVQTINRAIKKKSNFDRKTFLCDLLKTNQ